MSLNYRTLFAELAKQPQVADRTMEVAKRVQRDIETLWPELTDVDDRQRAFLSGDGRAVKVTRTTGSNRPTVVVTVRHPGAVAKQAKDGFVTRAVRNAR